jgi:hypothetical protein
MMVNSHLSSEPKITQDSAEQCHVGEGKDATESRFEGYGVDLRDWVFWNGHSKPQPRRSLRSEHVPYGPDKAVRHFGA